MYKLVAIDLDGTLLNSYGEVSDENRKTIRACAEKGIYIVLASGRTISSVKNLAVDLEADKYIISGNGAVVFDFEKNDIIYNRFLTKKQVLDIANICEENSIFYNVYSEQEIITKSLNYNVLFYHKENAKKNTILSFIRNLIREEEIKRILEEMEKIFRNLIDKYEINHIEENEIKKTFSGNINENEKNVINAIYISKKIDEDDIGEDIGISIHDYAVKLYDEHEVEKIECGENEYINKDFKNVLMMKLSQLKKK